MAKRKTTFRGIEVELDCGCRHVLSTSFYRLSAARAACIVGDELRKAQMCETHGFGQQITKRFGTVPL